MDTVTDRMDGLALWCELWLDPEGDITLTRGHGCTLADAIDLCRLVVAADPTIHDRTECEGLPPDHPAYSWLRAPDDDPPT